MGRRICEIVAVLGRGRQKEENIMSQRFQVSGCANALFSLCLAVAATDLYGQPPPAVPAAPPAPAAQQLPEPEVLEQGPIHEAFAEPLALQAEAAEIVSRRPPEPIEELPPEYQPEGRNVQWISGYFMWQQELDDFVWVSGFYRDLPPGRTWVPGAWHEVERGHQWAPGFWAEGNLEELQYLPTPPATLEQGPSSPAPGDRYLWAPGCWQWRGIGYAWQPGYWYQAQPDWVWVPSHYTYTPYGCVYVGGYWDFPFALRGLLYAPLYWGRGFNWHGGYYYRPHHVLNTALLVASLFID
ncbi:MAG: YXWGXW repeat-containing protein, partial [Planctomycetes bacterium]|nr:YXWGXW repeat-containing protein [Planctomycetota bacterium]